MLPVIGEILPLAVVAATSPLPIVATILMLLAPRAKAAGVGFLLGWFGGLLVVVLVLSVIVALLPESSGSGVIVGLVKILLGSALVVLGVRKWAQRPQDGAEAAVPRWMATIDQMTGGRAFRLGALLAIANPKNILLVLAAAVTVGASGLTIAEEIIAVAVFIAVATASVAIPVIAYLVAARRMQRPLEVLRAWLIQNNAVVIAVQAVVIGVAVIGTGIGRL